MSKYVVQKGKVFVMATSFLSHYASTVFTNK